jgi:glycosyltransferase involved in cell wall biosynthesis
VHSHLLVNEVLVVDEGSSDNTNQKVKKYQSMGIIKHKKNKGNACFYSINDFIDAKPGTFIFT